MGNPYFKERVKMLRRKSGVTLDGLARELHVTKSCVSMWEQNGTVPREKTLRELARRFGVSVDYLLGSEDVGGVRDPSDPGRAAKVEVLRRGINSMSDEDLDKARALLSIAFKDLFDSDSGDKTGGELL